MRTRALSEEKVSRTLLRLYLNECVINPRSFLKKSKQARGWGNICLPRADPFLSFQFCICSNSEMEFKTREIIQNKSVEIK